MQNINMFQAWSVAARLRTLPIPTVHIVTAASLAYSATGRVDWPLLLCAWLVSIFVTMGVNLINDVIDFEKGADKPNRVGFLKVISAGLIPKEHVKIAGFTCLALTVFFAIPLALHAGWVVFLLVLLSVACAYGYTGGPFPISYLGLSELFIVFFYGFVCVGATYYVQTKALSMGVLLCSLQMGLLAALPNALNNFRDRHDDERDGKLTLAVRFGRDFARKEVAVLTGLPFILGLQWINLGHPEAAWLPLCLAPLAFLFVKTVWKVDPTNQLFGLGVLIHFLFGLLLSVGFLLR